MNKKELMKIKNRMKDLKIEKKALYNQLDKIDEKNKNLLIFSKKLDDKRTIIECKINIIRQKYQIYLIKIN